MNVTGDCWAEQEAVEDWFKKHSMELKKAVSVARIEADEKLRGLIGVIEALHTHPGMEQQYGIGTHHVIVDKLTLDKLKELIRKEKGDG